MAGGGVSAELAVLPDLSSASRSAHTTSLTPGGSMVTRLESHRASVGTSISLVPTTGCSLCLSVPGVFCLLNQKVSFQVYDTLKIRDGDVRVSLLSPLLLYKVKNLQPLVLPPRRKPPRVLQTLRALPLQDSRETACDVAVRVRETAWQV